MKPSDLKDANLWLVYDQSIRVAVISVLFTSSITLLVYHQGSNHRATSLRTQTPSDSEAGYNMRKLLSAPPGDGKSSNGLPVDLMIPVKDPAVIEAEKFLRQAFNIKRQATCASIKSYDAPGSVQFAKISTGKGGAVRYRLEVVYGNETVFARIASKGAAINTFVLVSSIPSPCDGGLEGQPAVSFAGVLLIISACLMDSDDLCFLVLDRSHKDQQAKAALDCLVQPTLRGIECEGYSSRVSTFVREPK